MCITITVECDEATASKIEHEFVDGSTLEVSGNLSHWKQKRCTSFNLSDLDGVKGCACGLLGEGESWKADKWNFRPAVLPLLEATVARFGKLLSREFTFRTQWNSEKPIETIAVQLDELKRIIRNNEVRTRTQYRVAR